MKWRQLSAPVTVSDPDGKLYAALVDQIALSDALMRRLIGLPLTPTQLELVVAYYERLNPQMPIEEG